MNQQLLCSLSPWKPQDMYNNNRLHHLHKQDDLNNKVILNHKQDDVQNLEQKVDKLTWKRKL
jgi:hypothetical protein